MIGENPQGIVTTENSGNNILLKCLNSENSNENILGINKVNSKNILLKCLDTRENVTSETEQNGNSNEKILKCSNLVKIINTNGKAIKQATTSNSLLNPNWYTPLYPFFSFDSWYNSSGVLSNLILSKSSTATPGVLATLPIAS